MDQIRQDLRFAARQLWRHPAFSLTAILTLALGLGANTAIFSALHALTWRTLPYPAADRLAALHRDGKPAGASQEELALWRREARTVQASAGLSLRTWGLDSQPGIEVVLAGMFTPGFFDVLGVQPLFGRAPNPADRRTVWLTHAFWRRRFDGDASVAARVIRLNEESYTIAGVLPASFIFTSAEQTPDLYFPLEAGYLARQVLVRLMPGATREQAQQELRALAANAGDRQAAQLALRDLREELRAGADGPYVILMAAVATVLLVACLNLANLLLARFAVRVREMAVRSSVGASHGRLVQQFLTEALLLTGIGTAAAVLTAHGALSWIQFDSPGLLFEPRLDSSVLLFLGLLALAVVALLTSAPALMLRRLDLHTAMKPPRAGWRRGLLIAGQVAGGLALLATTALLLRSFAALTAVDPGFRTDNLLVAGIGIPEVRYDTGAKMARFYEEVLAKMAAIPGVEAAAGASSFPLVSSHRTWLRLPGMTVPDDLLPTARITMVSPSFLATTGIALRAGRAFDDGDRVGRPRVALVNEAFVRQLSVALGQSVKLSWWDAGNPRWTPWEVTGVVADTRSRQLDLAPEPHIYLPLNQFASEGLIFGVRTRAANYQTVAAEMTRAVHAVDPLIQKIEPRPLTARIAASLAERQGTLRLITAFAVVALLLCATGLFGLTAYSVRQSSRELAIRRALGAEQSAVVWSALRHSLLWSLAGVAGGFALSAFAVRAVESQLYGVTARDPLALAGALAALAVALLAGCWWPARRATQMDPASVLRHE